jgi:hypothetical protein
VYDPFHIENISKYQLGEVSPKAAAIIFKSELEEKMKRNAIILECEAQHTLR